MEINREGITRTVFIFKNIVIKIPNTSSWRQFLRGLIANIDQKHRWDEAKSWKGGKPELLGPVLFCSWGGWFLIMPRIDVEKHIQECYDMYHHGNLDNRRRIEKRYKKWIKAGHGGDDKCDNYGYYQNRLVKIDYD